MKIKLFSFLAAFVMAVCLYSCAGEDNTGNHDNGGKQDVKPEGKAFAGFIDSTAAKTATRTGGIYGPISGGKTGVRFYWNTNEYSYYRLFVNVGTETSPIWAYPASQKTLSTDAKGKISQLQFNNFRSYSGGTYQTDLKFDRENYQIRYLGTGGSYDGNTSQVAFTSYQSQLNPNDAELIGQYGDCGMATAIDNGIWYEFTLKHCASYITFLPYAGAGNSQATLLKCKLRSVTLQTDEAINGYFPFDNNGVNVSNRPAANGSNNITVSQCNNNNGFEVTDTKDKSIEKTAVIMVLPPGTYHNVKIIYTLYDPVVQTEGQFVKKIATLTLPAGKNQPIASSLTCDDFSSRFDKYHMWGATDYYWNSVFPAPREWGSTGIPLKPGFNPPSAGQGRFYYDQVLPEGVGNIAPVGTLDHDAPSANLLSWYVKYGDPRWDPQPFTYDGHLFTGRMWFLKKSVIADQYTVSEQYMNDVSADRGIYDLRTLNGRRSFSNSAKKWEDVGTAQRANYFYVMPLGYYEDGNLRMQSNYYGYYWTSTSYLYTNSPVNHQRNRENAYYLSIYPSGTYLEADWDGPNLRKYGYQPWQGETQ